jgi:AraC-like DNA-binding protein
MFVEIVRRHLEALPAGEAGWLSGLRDPAIGRVLAMLHERPGHSWTLNGLARDAGVSRAVLAERFAQLVGCPPMHYLALWRMQTAARLLADGTGKVAAGGVQPRVQADGRHAAGGMAPAAPRRSSRSHLVMTRRPSPAALQQPEGWQDRPSPRRG